MATNTSNRQIAINLTCSIAAMSLGYIISFWLSPFIVKHIGVEANGFISLASNFVAYAGLVLVALNSMAGRFITISYVKKDFKQANLYFNSVYWGNVLMGFVLIAIAATVILNLNHFIEIPIHLDTDVKILFTLVFGTFIIIRFTARVELLLEKCIVIPRIGHRALNYAKEISAKVFRWREDADYELDNNFAERSARPIATSRKTSLFHGSHEGAENECIIRSFFETCRLRNVSPVAWFREFFKAVIQGRTDYPNLLPGVLPIN